MSGWGGACRSFLIQHAGDHFVKREDPYVIPPKYDWLISAAAIPSGSFISWIRKMDPQETGPVEGGVC